MSTMMSESIGTTPNPNASAINPEDRICDPSLATLPPHCDASYSTFEFWFHGVTSLVVNIFGFVGSMLFLPVMAILFIREKRKKRPSSATLSEFYLLLSLLLACSVINSIMESWEWSLPRLNYAMKIQHEEIRLYQDFFREINDTAYIYFLVFITYLRYRTTANQGPFGLVRVTALVTSVYFFAFVYILPTFFTKKPGAGCFDRCLNRVIYKLVKTSLRTSNRLYIFIYKTNIVFFVSFVLPFFLLGLFNYKIVKEIKNVAKMRTTLTASVRNSNYNSLQNQVFKICLWVTAAFLVCRLPYFVAILIRYFGELAQNKQVENTKEFQEYMKFCIFLICFNPTLIIGAFLLPSSALRQTFYSFYHLNYLIIKPMTSSNE